SRRGYMSRRYRLLVFLAVGVLFASHGTAFASKQPSVQPGVETTVAQTTSGSNPQDIVTLPENYTSEQVDAILARLSDDQVRQLLIAELRKAASDPTADRAG
ncbi:hypothetical protein C6A37_11955, partial [Desulfobacteraceae bacterium SEEP-SAG9]